MRRFKRFVSEGVSLAQSEYFLVVRFPILAFDQLNNFYYPSEMLLRVFAYR